MEKVIRHTEGSELPGIIIMSHGPMAAAMVGSAEMIFGEVENIAGLSLERNDGPEDMLKDLKETLALYPEGTVVLVDIFGGTPCNVVMRYASETGKVLDAMSGVNLPVILETINNRYSYKGEELLNKALEIYKEGATNLKETAADFLK